MFLESSQLKPSWTREVHYNASLQFLEYFPSKVLTFLILDELYLDLKYFYGYFYKNLMNLKTRKEFKLADKCFYKLFIARKDIPTDRVSSFIHRLLIISGSLNGLQAFKCLEIIKRLLDSYPKCRGLFEKSEKVGSGLFNGIVDDPDLVNPYAMDVWMVSLLSRHYHPKVKQAMKNKIFH